MKKQKYDPVAEAVWLFNLNLILKKMERLNDPKAAEREYIKEYGPAIIKGMVANLDRKSGSIFSL